MVKETEYTCLQCGKKFKRRSGYVRKFCSSSCNVTYQNLNTRNYASMCKEHYIFDEEKRTKKCIQCGKEFYTKTDRKKCCSTECGIIYHNKHFKDYTFMRGKNNIATKYCKGVPLKPEHKKLISIGVKTSPKYIAAINSESYRKNLSKALKGRIITWKIGGYLKHKYKDIKMRSSWEVKTAKWLDENNIEWEYESKKCIFNRRQGNRYIIDFYLPKLNKYIEVKGWWDDYSIEKYNEAAEQLDMCIIDKRNIDNITLDIKEVI